MDIVQPSDVQGSMLESLLGGVMSQLSMRSMQSCHKLGDRKNQNYCCFKKHTQKQTTMQDSDASCRL